MSTFRYQHIKGTIQDVRDKLYISELGVNTNKDNEAIYLKNENGEVIEFSPKKAMDDNVAILNERIKAISELVGVEGDNTEGYDDSGSGILDEVHRNLAEAREKLKKINEKRIVYWSEDEGAGRRHIVLPNHDSIVGTMKSGDNANLLMLSKWDKADIGSAKVEVNLNGKGERPTYNDLDEIALTKDIPTLEVEGKVLVVNTFLNKK